MPTSITRDQLIAMRPCNPNTHLARFGKRKSMTIRQAFNSGATIKDLLWVAGQLGRKDLCVKFALACAVRAGRFTKDQRVHDCLAATQTYIDNSSKMNLAALTVARRKIVHGTYAAYAAYTAYTAAYAAYATYAAAAVADAAADAATTTYTERQKEIKAQKALFIKIFS